MKDHSTWRVSFPCMVIKYIIGKLTRQLPDNQTNFPVFQVNTYQNSVHDARNPNQRREHWILCHGNSLTQSATLLRNLSGNRGAAKIQSRLQLKLSNSKQIYAEIKACWGWATAFLGDGRRGCCFGCLQPSRNGEFRWPSWLSFHGNDYSNNNTAATKSGMIRIGFRRGGLRPQWTLSGYLSPVV